MKIAIPVSRRRPGRPSTRKSGRSAHFTVRLDADLYKRFDKLCQARGQARNSIVERLIHNFVTRNR